MVQVFREVRRVLRDDGTCWINLGDSYAVQGGKRRDEAESAKNAERAARRGYDVGGWSGRTEHIQRSVNTAGNGAKPKDLLMMPARLALALQADGWWLRSDIIWSKPNPMPESVTDRPTSAHEHILLLTKRSRYYFDQEAVREEAEYGRSEEYGAKIWARSGIPTEPGRTPGSRTVPGNGGTRNLRNVWTIATAPFPAAHFATFPPELAERCIRAGTSQAGCCAQCGKPWVRVTEQELHRPPAGGTTNQKGPRFNLPRIVETTTTGWSPGCTCNAEVAPCVVLDPFSGAGTALLVADRLGRDAIGIDLSHAYVELARERLQADCPLFADITDAPVPSEDAYDRDMRDLFEIKEAAD